MYIPPTDRAPHSGWYRIRIKGRLPSRWATHFDGMTLSTTDDGVTLLAGPVVDQAALHGLLQQVRDTGLPLISVDQVASQDAHQIDPDAPTTPR